MGLFGLNMLNGPFLRASGPQGLRALGDARMKSLSEYSQIYLEQIGIQILKRSSTVLYLAVMTGNLFDGNYDWSKPQSLSSHNFCDSSTP